MGLYRPMTPSSRQCAAREKEHPSLLDIGSMSPPDYPSAWLHPCRARFRFTRQVHCSSMLSGDLNFGSAHDPTGIRASQSQS